MEKIQEKYDQELVVIGIHSAKFPNERSKENLYNAVRRYELTHPVINDPQFQIWRQYACRAWPTLMFVNPKGKVVGKHEGEITHEALDLVVSRLINQFDNDKTIDRSPTSFNQVPITSQALCYPGKLLSNEATESLFISDSNHNQILIASLGGEIQSIVGSGLTGLADGSFTESEFNHPQGLAIKNNKVYVADTGNHAIREIDLGLMEVTTIAGDGSQGSPSTNMGQGKSISLNSPWDITCVADDLFIAMAGSHQLWRMNLTNHEIGPYAGSGQESLHDGPLATSTLAQPSGITADTNHLYFADSETSAIRYASLDSGGNIETIVGQDLFVFGDVDGDPEHCRLQHPLGVIYRRKTLYIADTYNHKIKCINLESRITRTIFGSGESGAKDGVGTAAEFSEPSGLSIAGDYLYIADTNNHIIRKANLSTHQVITMDIQRP